MIAVSTIRRLAGLGLALLVVCAPCPAQTAVPGGPFHYTLRNGLEVILSEDPGGLPLVSVAVSYRVGSADDPPGKAGLAYLMETLMFAGSANVPPSQHINTLYRIGGSFNASVSENRTIFFQTVPSNYLGLVLWLESDRMRSLEITAEAFESTKNDHLAEIRRRRLEQPYLEAQAVFDQAAFSNPVLSHPLEGTETSLDGLTIDDARAFYNESYVPNRVVLSIAGQFDRLKARDLVARYFETVPRGKDLPRLAPSPNVPARKTPLPDLVDGLATSPAFFLGYRLGPAGSPDMVALRLIEFVLLKGPTARLNRRLLNRNNKIAYQLDGGIDIRGDAAVFRLFVVTNTPEMIEISRTAAMAEFEKLRRTFLTEEELIRAKRAFKADYLDRQSTPTGRALSLAEAFLAAPDFPAVIGELGRFMGVTPYDIRSAANRYFVSESAIVVNVGTK
jgi:zinc protease